MGLQGGNHLFGGLDLLHGQSQLPADGTVVLPPQLRQEPGGDIQHGGGDIVPAGQLQQQAFGQVPGAHSGGLQALDGLQALVDQRLGNVQLLQPLQVPGVQIPVLVHHIGYVFGQGQQGLGQPLPVQLVTEKGLQALCLPVCPATFRQIVVLVGEGGGVDTAVDPAGLLAQLVVSAAEVRVVLLLHQRVFLGDFSQVFQQLLGVHLQNFHGLQQLRRQLQLLPQLGFQRDETHGLSTSCQVLDTYLAIFRAAVAWEMPSSLATATVVPQRW